VEADVGYVVLAAAVRAAAHLDVDALGEGIGDVHLLHPLLDRAIQPHRAGDAEFAAVGSGAADHVADLARAGLAEAELGQPLPDVVEGAVGPPAQDEVLLHGAAGAAARVLAHDLPEPAELVRGQ